MVGEECGAKRGIERDEAMLYVKKEYKVTGVKKLKENRESGQNKSRHIQHSRDPINLCQLAALEEECKIHNCRRSHDVKAFLEQKLPDLGSVCPLFSVYGKCRFGVKCRFFSGHSANPPSGTLETETVKNHMGSEFMKRLRKKQFDFTRTLEFQNEFRVHDGQVALKQEKPSEDDIDGIQEKEFKFDQEFLVKLRKSEKKKIDFKGKTYLAPLTTVGNLPFRRLCKYYGVDITCGEMALTNSLMNGNIVLSKGNQQEWALLKRHRSETIFGVQLTGSNTDGFTRVCNIIQQELDVDFVDINLGCPVEAICNRGAGSALMLKRNKLREMVMGASTVLDCPVTVKLRTGITERRIAHNLIPLLESWGASAITLHGRSKKQRYTKSADWDYITQCAQTAKNCQFIGNGDIFNPEDYFNALETVDSAMIGRGALIKPWIFKEIKEKKLWDISSSERFEMLKTFANYGLEHWGSDTQGVNVTRRYLCEMLSFNCRYVPLGIIETLPQRLNLRPERFVGRDELETLLSSPSVKDWIKITERILGPSPDDFKFIPKHKSSSYEIPVEDLVE